MLAHLAFAADCWHPVIRLCCLGNLKIAMNFSVWHGAACVIACLPGTSYSSVT